MRRCSIGNQALSQLNNDMTNLIANVHIPTVMLGKDLHIRLVTPIAEKLLNLIPTDIGRSITDLNLPIRVPGLAKVIAGVVKTQTPRELEVQDSHERWFSVRFRPYKTVDNHIDGVVITFVDIDLMRRSAAKSPN